MSDHLLTAPSDIRIDRNKRPVFVLALQADRGIDGVKALRAALKTLRRRYGLRAVAIRETPKYFAARCSKVPWRS